MTRAVLLQSPEATRLALKIHAKAVRKRGEQARALPAMNLQAEVDRLERLVGEQQEIIKRHYRIVATVRVMVRRYRADHYCGRADQWADLCRHVEALDRRGE